MTSFRHHRAGVRLAILPLIATAALVGLSPAVLPAGSATASAPVAAAPATLRVGSQLLTRCDSSPATYCGTLEVPLNWSGSAGPDISVCYRWYPARGSGRPAGTVMPVEGGPGYPSIGSVAPDGYRAMYGPLLERFNMLAIDLRGTGCSTVLDCEKLQDYSGPSGSLELAAVVGACADALDHRWRAPGGGYVHASDLFTSAASAEDVAAVIRALDVRQVDLYGDSYGSWFAQVFAARYPSLVRSVILDSTYQVQSLDPWYRITIATMPGDFDVVCAESPACAAVGGRAWPRIEALAARLRSGAISGTVPGPDGNLMTVKMGVVGLVNLVSDSAEDPGIYAALDAAARALLDDNEPAPLLRLYASRLAFDEAYFNVPVSGYSVELYMAVSCLDYPQLYPLSAGEPERLADLKAAEATLPASTFTPFTTAEWLAMDQNTENYTACLDWPRPTIAETPIPATPPFLPPGMPVLILGGQLDTWTPPAGVPEVEAEIGGKDRFVEFRSETHVVGEFDVYGCASSIIRAFVRHPAALSSLDVSCAAAIPTLRAVGAYPAELRDVVPLTPRSGSAGGTTLELASAAVQTAGDAWSRIASIAGTHDLGLYGGAVSESSSGRLTLRDDQLVPGVKVSGTVTPSGSDESSVLTAVLRVQGPGGAAASVKGSWLVYGGAARADVTVSRGGESATGSMPAPEGVPY
jgi:pimeloyl-ACP methyl ester carboxylesterase